MTHFRSGVVQALERFAVQIRTRILHLPLDALAKQFVLELEQQFLSLCVMAEIRALEYIIYDYMFRILSMADCSYLNGCVTV